MDKNLESEDNKLPLKKEKPTLKAVSKILDKALIGKGGPKHITEGFGNIDNPKDLSYLD